MAVMRRIALISATLALAVPASASAAFHVYVADNASTSKLSELTVGPTGALSPSSGAPTAQTGGDPINLLIAPSGQNLYALNSTDHTVSEFTISSVGVLSPRSRCRSARATTSPCRSVAPASDCSSASTN
jgi:DNA-binding beta-propeller fold protein YncE